MTKKKLVYPNKGYSSSGSDADYEQPTENILLKIKQWLEDEIEYNREVVEAQDNGEEFTSDGTDDIILGRSECAESLLDQINKWEMSRDSYE